MVEVDRSTHDIPLGLFYSQLESNPAFTALCDEMLKRAKDELAEAVEGLADGKIAESVEKAITASNKYRHETELIYTMRNHVKNNMERHASRKESK